MSSDWTSASVHFGVAMCCCDISYSLNRSSSVQKRECTMKLVPPAGVIIYRDNTTVHGSEV